MALDWKNSTKKDWDYPEELICQGCGKIFPYDHLTNGYCLTCFEWKEND